MTVYILTYTNPMHLDETKTIGAFDSGSRAYEYIKKACKHNSSYDEDYFDIETCKVNPCFETEFS